jgi:hypothetical protein
VKLNGINIPTPREDMEIKETEIGKSERTASGRLVKDITTTKNTYTLSYKGLLPADALTFINLYRSGEAVIFEYEDVEGIHSKEVYINPLPRKIYNLKPQYTKDVTVIFEEV